MSEKLVDIFSKMMESKESKWRISISYLKKSDNSEVL